MPTENPQPQLHQTICIYPIFTSHNSFKQPYFNYVPMSSLHRLSPHLYFFHLFLLISSSEANSHHFVQQQIYKECRWHSLTFARDKTKMMWIQKSLVLINTDLKHSKRGENSKSSQNALSVLSERVLWRR